MDENKNTANNGETQTDSMNYSFDFANQVDNSVKVATPEATNNSVSAQATAEAPVQPATVEASVQPVTAETPVQPAATEAPVQPAVTSSPATNVTPASADNSVNQAPATMPDNTPAQADENPIMPGVAPTIPVTPETVAANQDADESLELIKDKKATKRFLLMLFVLIFAFIIALPIIFNILG